MAVTLNYGFYNSHSSDRVYDATHFGKIFNGVIRDGVFQSEGEFFKVSASSGVTVRIGTGRAWFNGTWSYMDAAGTLDLPAADNLLPRIDAVVLEVDASDAVRQNQITYIQGVKASTPARPTLLDTDTVHQHALAYILREAAETAIKAANITNVVGTKETPFVIGPLKTITVDDLLAQLNAEFNDWFDAMKGQLSEDAAGNLQNEIDALATVNTATFSIAGWVLDSSNGYYTQSVAVTGMTANGTPVLDLVTSGNAANMEAQQDAWALILQAETLSGYLKLYASETPSIDFTVQIKGV